MTRRRLFAFDALPVDTMAIPVAGFGASSYVDLDLPRCFGYGGLPATAYATTVAKAALQDKDSAALSSPEAKLAASVFEAAMSGNVGSATAAITSAANQMAAVGATAACAATGAGAAVAPLCGMAGSLLFGKISSFLGSGSGKPCLNAQEEVAQAQMAPYLSGGPANTKLFCDGDAACEGAIAEAAYEYADRINWWCSMFYYWPLTATIVAEGKKLGLPPWPVPPPSTPNPLAPQAYNEAIRRAAEAYRLRYTYDFRDPRWAAYAKSKFLGDVSAAVAKRKLKTWTTASATAKALADKEYDALVRACPPPPRINRGGGLPACQRKAADAATIIAARAYMYSVIDGAPAVQATEVAGLRSQFAAEVAQDAMLAKLAKQAADKADADAKLERAVQSDAIRASLTRKKQRPTIVLGFALATAVVAGGIYLHRRRG
jgi:hypothetical protein